MKELNEKEKKKLKKILKIVDTIENNPETIKKMEENQRKYGTLTAEDLKKQFTI